MQGFPNIEETSEQKEKKAGRKNTREKNTKPMIKKTLRLISGAKISTFPMTGREDENRLKGKSWAEHQPENLGRVKNTQKKIRLKKFRREVRRGDQRDQSDHPAEGKK